MRNHSSRVRKPSQRRTSGLVNGTRLRILFWGDIVHAQRVQLQHPEITAIFDIDQTSAEATRQQLLPKLVREGVLIAVPHSSFFPPLGRLRKEGSGYSWAPVVFTDQWDQR
jgi:hypothetical protein